MTFDSVPGVRRSAAIGIPSETDFSTEHIAVIAEVKKSVELVELRKTIPDRVRQSVGFVPDRVIFVPTSTIPRTHNGKIRYYELKERIAANQLPVLGAAR